MVENRPLATAISHLVLILGVLIIAFPLYITLVASSHTAQEIVQAPMPVLPGPHLVENYKAALLGTSGSAASGCMPRGVTRPWKATLVRPSGSMASSATSP